MKQLCDQATKKPQIEYEIKYKLFESMLQKRIKTHNSINEKGRLSKIQHTKYTWNTQSGFFSCLKNDINPFSEFFLRVEYISLD